MLALNENQIVDRLIQSCCLPQETEIARFVPESFYNQNSVIFCHNQSESFVVKVFSPKNLPRCENEINALKQFSKISFPIPDLINQGIIKSGDEILFGYIVMSKINGHPLDEVIDGYDLSALEKISMQILSFLRSQRDFNDDLGIYLPCDEDILSNKLKNFLLEPTLSMLKEMGISEANLLSLIERSAYITKPKTFSYVTHDWRLRHIFVDRDEVTGIIDLEYLKPNDFAAEIAHFLHDLILHRSSEARVIGWNILNNLSYIAPDDQTLIERLPLWMAKQAITHAHGKATSGFPKDVLVREVGLALQYGELTPETLKQLFNP